MDKKRQRKKNIIQTEDLSANELKGKRTGALSVKEIIEIIDRKYDRLVIMPPLYGEKALYRANTIDLRLGNEFIIMRKAELSTLEFERGRETFRRDLRRFYETVYVSFDDDFVLHPGELVLGATFEYLVIPKDVVAYIIGRSSWGRLGLIIATATIIHPGFKGCPTLELINLGNIPIRLLPSSPIPVAQLILHWVGPGQKGYSGLYFEKFVGSTGPEYSHMHEGSEFKKWVKYRLKERKEMKRK